jgi:V/A-type H+-transporting ATPase subunit I
MDRVLIVGTKDVMEPTINAIHDMNLLHIEDYIEEGEYFKIGKPLNTATPLSEKLLKLRSIKSYLGTKVRDPAREKREKVLKDIDKYLAELEAAVSKKTGERSTLESELKEMNRREDALKPYVALGLRPELLHGYENVAAFVGTAPGDPEPAVKAITPDYEYFSSPFGRGQVVAIFVPKVVTASVSDALMKNDFVEIEPTRETGEPAVIVRGIEDRKAGVNARLEAIGKELQNLDSEFAQFIISSEELLSIDTQKAEAPLRFAISDNTFIIDGWVPQADYQKLRAGLAEATAGRVYVTQIEPEPAKYAGEIEAPHEHIGHREVNAPVKYDNPKFMEPAQTFIDMYSRPKYSEIDPTAIFFFLFPLFYGFILGDVGYGLLLLIMGAVLTYVFRRSPGMTALTKTLVLCSFWTIVFGLVFGEFLGYFIKDFLPWLYPDHLTIGPFGPFYTPVERMMPGGPEGGHGPYVIGMKDLLVFTCLIGVAQLTLGYLLGFKNELKMHGLKTAFLHKFSWLFILYGGLSIVWYVFPLISGSAPGSIEVGNPMLIAGLALAVIGLIMLLMGEGALGMAEIPALMSNVLSYTRLLAVGLSSVGIAVALKTIVGMLWAIGPAGWVFAIVVFLFGHTINLLLGILAPGLHALRLHYVEFFMKFYKGGGRIYSPFGYNRKYTEE